MQDSRHTRRRTPSAGGRPPDGASTQSTHTRRRHRRLGRRDRTPSPRPPQRTGPRPRTAHCSGRSSLHDHTPGAGALLNHRGVQAVQPAQHAAASGKHLACVSSLDQALTMGAVDERGSHHRVCSADHTRDWEGPLQSRQRDPLGMRPSAPTRAPDSSCGPLQQCALCRSYSHAARWKHCTHDRCPLTWPPIVVLRWGRLCTHDHQGVTSRGTVTETSARGRRATPAVFEACCPDANTVRGSSGGPGCASHDYL